MIYVKTSKLPGFFQAHQDATLFLVLFLTLLQYPSAIQELLYGT